MIADKNTTPFELEIIQVTPIFSDNLQNMPEDINKESTFYKTNNLLNLDWYSLNDGVMGGISRGIMKSDGDVFRYYGQLSLENNGGFSTVRTNVEFQKFHGELFSNLLNT